MYITTIIKTTKENIFAGFNMFSNLLLNSDLFKELNSYEVPIDIIDEIINMQIGDRKMIEITWKNFNVFITLYKI